MVFFIIKFSGVLPSSTLGVIFMGYIILMTRAGSFEALTPVLKHGPRSAVSMRVNEC